MPGFKPEDRLSPHFTLGEFISPHDPDGVRHFMTSPVTYRARLVKLCACLEQIRAAFGGRPVKITSGLRSPAHNAAVGGVADSQHVKARAADIVIAGVSPRDVAGFARTLAGLGGVGLYVEDGFTHCDVRDRSGGPLAYWEG